MSIDVKITCDHCGADITHTGNSVDYRLALTAQRKSMDPACGGCVTDMGIEPPIAGDRHFCGMRCLVLWAEDCNGGPRRG